MANVIKHKRGTSDPTASDLVVGEVAIRTDVGKLFTKMDNGSVAEIAGGGSDIIINTLSSSSATGGGSATFNGSAYRFTLSQPPSVSAQQLLVSIAGVIQKPIAGNNQPSEGFSISGNDIILAAAPATGTDFFILTFKSLGVSEPADNTVTSAKIVDGAIVNADINASAAIAVSKLANFVTNNADNRVITGSGTANTLEGEANLTFSGGATGDATLTVHAEENNNASEAFLKLETSNDFAESVVTAHDSSGVGGSLKYNHGDNAWRFTTNADNERMRIDSSGRLLIGTTTEGHSTADDLTVATSGHTGISIRSGSSNNGNIYFSDGTSGNAELAGYIQYSHSNNSMLFGTNESNAMLIDSSGNVGIGTTSPTARFDVRRSDADGKIAEFHQSAGYGIDIGSSQSVAYISSGYGQALTFKTDPSSGQVERMRITSDGKITSTVTSPNPYNTIQTNLELVNGAGNQGAGSRIDFSCGNGKAHIQSQVTGGNSNSGLSLIFATSLDANGADERMRLTTGGKLGIGGNPARMFSVSTPSTQGNIGTAEFANNKADNGAAVMFMSTLRDGSASESFLQCNKDQDNNGTGVQAVFLIRTNGDCDSATNSYGGISDIKLKENIVDANSQWDDIKNIKIRNFNFKSNPSQKMLGVVAQEVETVSAGLVKESPDENLSSSSSGDEGTTTKSVKYSILYMKAIKALQEAQVRIETLETKVEALEAG